MTDKQTLLDLADRVDAGEADDREVMDHLFKSKVIHDRVIGDERVWLVGPIVQWPLRHILTSLDAAQALHDAVLPGWSFHIGGNVVGSASVLVASLYDGVGPILEGKGNAPTPAAAWVAAILRAKASQ